MSRQLSVQELASYCIGNDRLFAAMQAALTTRLPIRRARALEDMVPQAPRTLAEKKIIPSGPSETLKFVLT